MFIDADFTNSSGIVGTQSSHNLILRTAGTNKVWVTTGGNVGIGTASPGAKLQVEGGELRATTSNSGVALYQNSGVGEIAAYNWGGGAYIPLVHVGSEHRFNTSTTERMRITSGGQLLLGISSTSETTKLFVKQSQDLDYRGISVESAAAGGFFGSMSIDANGNLSFAHSYTGGSGSYRDIRFLTSNVERMRITSDGNVLIGTTTTPTPVSGVAFPLTVSSSAATRIRIDSTQATPNSGVGLYANGVQKFSFAMFGATSDFTIYNDALLASALLVKGTNSNVLIGTTTDTSDKLRVNGTTFSNDIMTWNPENDNRSGVAWRFGAKSDTIYTSNKSLRVNVGGVEYWILAREV
jgi:hypothetical protein